MVEGKDDRLVALLERQIEATDRVNHAVRAIVIPSLILLVAILLASPFLLIGFFVPYFDGVLFLAGFILLFGATLAIVSQIKESALSATPDELSKSNRPAPPVALATDRPVQEYPPKKTPFELVEGTCECSKWDRGAGNYGVHEGVKYCGRCYRALRA